MNHLELYVGHNGLEKIKGSDDVYLKSVVLVRMLLLRKTIFLSIKDYIYNIYIPIATVTIISIIVPLLVYFYMPDGFGKFLTICISCAFSIVLTTYFCGLSKHEKEVILKKIILKIKK